MASRLMSELLIQALNKLFWFQLISSSIFAGDTRRKRTTSFSGTMPHYLQQLPYSFKRATKLLLRSSVPFLINIFGNAAIQLYGHSI